MIVDGLGHVSLDSSSNTVQGNAFSQANIHQGSIPATGRKDKSQQQVPTNLTTPMSAANSLQFNQLIGGAISPSVISQQNGSAPSVSSSSTGGSSVMSPSSANANQHLMIGDYAQVGGAGNMGNVLTSPFRQ